MSLTLSSATPGIEEGKDITPPTVNPTDIPPQGTPEYLSYMANLGRQASGEVPVTPQNQEDPVKSPLDGVPPKFVKDGQVDLQALVKSYSELEKKFSGKTEDAPAAQPQVTPEEGDVSVYQGYFKELEESGELSEDSYKALTAKFPKYLVDGYVKMAQSYAELAGYKQAQDEAEIFNAIGGQQNFQALSTWAQQSLSPAEVAAYNQQLTVSKESAMLAVMGLKARYESVNGRVPSLVSGGVASASDVYQDKTDFLNAMSDPRYSADSNYRQSVYQKLARTRQSNPSFSV